MDKMIFGLFEDVNHTNMALDELYSSGIKRGDVSVIVKDSVGKEVISKEVQSTGENIASNAAGGALTGAVVGALSGLLIGIGAIAIPGVGGLLIAGPIAASLGLTGAAATTASGAATGAVAGGFIGSLVGLGLPEKQANVYQDSIRAGSLLVIVNADTETEKSTVESIFQKHGAREINYYTLTA